MRALLLAALVTVGCGAFTPTPTVQTCAERYQACVLAARSYDEYLVCRARVDADCLPQKDGGAE